ncbi:acyltransferase family protein [Abyssalbus ytuae]|uniref:Acyltransferase n=1 Tax=Abyssalbus ytuae TaxID=2926907 RepID=A0A9E7D1K9_9FLAO|nr:acyltransferase family protein [Abyssalbus ytuae]UOB19420.1 acyltransferase [Abyssalbus ytuae]
MNEYLSNKLKVFSFVLMILVVYLHSYNRIINLKNCSIEINYGINLAFQEFISNGIRIAVPLFFAISGYLFFANIKEFPFLLYRQKVSKRLKTLVKPYFFWSVFWLLIYFLLQSLPHSSSFFTETLIKDYTLIQLIDTIVFNPVAYQLWFIRDLIIIIVMTPLIYWGLKHTKMILISVLFIIWFININIVVFSNEGIFFFVLGAYLSIYKIDIQRLSYHYWLPFMSIWLLILFFKMYIEDIFIKILIQKAGILVGVLASWLLYDVIFLNASKNYYLEKESIILLTFFLFTTHEPTLTIIKKMLFYMLGTTELASFLIFIFAPIITIFICLSMGYLLKRFLLKFYFFITGGR